MRVTKAAREHVARRIFHYLDPEFIRAITSSNLSKTDQNTMVTFVRRRFKLIIRGGLEGVSERVRGNYEPLRMTNMVLTAEVERLVERSWLAVRDELRDFEPALIKLVSKMPAELVQSIHAAIAEDKLVAMVEWEALNGKKAKAKSGGGGAAG